MISFCTYLTKLQVVFETDCVIMDTIINMTGGRAYRLDMFRVTMRGALEIYLHKKWWDKNNRGRSTCISTSVSGARPSSAHARRKVALLVNISAWFADTTQRGGNIAYCLFRESSQLMDFLIGINIFNKDDRERCLPLTFESARFWVPGL